MPSGGGASNESSIENRNKNFRAVFLLLSPRAACRFIDLRQPIVNEVALKPVVCYVELGIYRDQL